MLKGVKTNLKVDKSETHFQISRKLPRIQFSCKLVKLMFLNDEFNGTIEILKKSF